MKAVFLAATMSVLCLANATGQGKLLTSDHQTGLPLIPAADPGKHIVNMSYTYNEPTQKPEARICESTFKGNFYSLFNIKVGAVVAWYSSHLSGFKKVSGYASQRWQTTFYNSDGTIVVLVTGDEGAQGENTNAYAVDQRYQPGISEKAITALAQEKMVCQ
jgi:hypothetical protein